MVTQLPPDHACVCGNRSTLPFEVLADDPECMERPNVRDRIAPLVGGAVGGVSGAWHPVLIWQGSIRLQGMANRGLNGL